MWAANANPGADYDNLQRLMSAMAEAAIGLLILISTVGVFDDVSAGYTETEARYETAKAYGRNRRALEVHALARHNAIVVRLPALFGPGLKKNFIFDLMNPIPSFLKPTTFEQVRSALTTWEQALMDRVFTFDDALSMFKLDRNLLEAVDGRRNLEPALKRAGVLATHFTNSASEYQYYNLANLKRDIETCVVHGLSVLNVCSEPWRVDDLHAALTGAEFANSGPPVVKEDVRTQHAGVFGRTGPYLYGRDEVLGDLRDFVRGKRA
jgi:hypothetical protein